jgi:hypothetical protein
MNYKTCLGCGEQFQARSQNPSQTYCSKKTCQSKRRRLWQKNKRQNDPDYRDNQMRAQRAWLERNVDYWKNYRSSHPIYAEQNRSMQRLRNSKQEIDKIAKMDASNFNNFPCTGLYRMIPRSQKKIAKMDVWTVELTLVDA